MRPLSWLLVALQFLLIGLLLTPLHALIPRSAADLPGALCILGAAALAIAALDTLKRHNFTVLPEPRPGATLITTGPYARIRHPMYTAVLLFGIGAAWLAGSATSVLQLVALSIVMILKARHEERLLLAAHAGYADYRARSHALVPGLY